MVKHSAVRADAIRPYARCLHCLLIKYHMNLHRIYTFFQKCIYSVQILMVYCRHSPVIKGEFPMVATEEYKAELYTTYHKKVCGYLNGKVNDIDLAEDLCADVFLKVFEKLDTFDDTKASVSTWIFTITRNTLTDYFRTRRVFSEIPEDLAEGSDIEENYCQNEMLEQLADALENLPERERDLIVLHYYSGKTLKEVADYLGISYAYVKILHNKALASMKNYF